MNATNTNGYSIGTVVTYTCDSGYRLTEEENEMRVCNPQGQWTRAPTTCEGMYAMCIPIIGSWYSKRIVDNYTMSA